MLPSMVSPTAEMVIWLPAGLAPATPRFDDDPLGVAVWITLGPVDVASCAVAFWSGADFPRCWTNNTVPAAMVRAATTPANHRHRWRPPVLA